MRLAERSGPEVVEEAADGAMHRDVIVRRIVVCLAAWLGLVAARFAARAIGVGPGARGALGLAELTAAVNVFWLLAVPAMLVLAVIVDRVKHRSVTVVAWTIAAALVCALETAWYRACLAVFHGRHEQFFNVMLSRAHVNLAIFGTALTAIALHKRARIAAQQARVQKEIEKSLIDAELNALQMQVQPHFLYNTLQLVAESAYSDETQAQRLLADLSRLLQRTFSYEERRFVRVAEEVDFLRAYCDIQQDRFSGHLTIDITMADDVADVEVPPLILQPLVENSIRHGIGRRAQPGRVHVHVQRENDGIVLIVEDDGVGFRDQTVRTKSDGRGLALTRRRLEFLYGATHTMEAGNAAHGGARVTIHLPTHGVPEPKLSGGWVDALPSGIDRTVLLQVVAGWSALILSLPFVLHRASAPAITIPTSHVDLLVSVPVWILLTCGALVTGARARTSGASGMLDHAVILGGALALHLFVAPWIALQMDAASVLTMARFAMWAPVDVLLYTLIIVLMRARDAALRAESSNRQSVAMLEEVARSRERIAFLHLCRRLMAGALAALKESGPPAEHDAAVLRASEFIRMVLASAEDGWSTVELEMELLRAYQHLVRPATTRPGSDMVIAVDAGAAHQRIPPGFITAMVDAALGGSMATSSRIAVSCRARDGALEFTVTTDGDHHALTSLARAAHAGLAEICALVRDLYTRACTFDVDRIDGALVVVVPC